MVIATNPAIQAEARVEAVPISQGGTDPNAPIQLAVPFPDVPRLSAEDVKSLKDSGAPIIIGDVRSQPEYEQGHIPGSIMLPGGQATGPVEQFPKEVVFVYYCTCQQEGESAWTAYELRRAGWLNAFALKGGLKAWTDAGFPLVTGR